MTLRARLVLAPAVLAGVATACSSSSSPPPEAFVAATLGGDPQLCQLGTALDVVTIGTAASDPIRAVDGDISNGGKVGISCTVSAKGDGFDISLTASLAGMGTLLVAGHVTSQGGQNVTGSFQTTSGAFRDSNCTIAYVYQGSPVPTKAGPPIAAGRIWAHISCPMALTTSGQMVSLPDGGTQTRQCDGEADFVFERCST